ncbi:MAG: hypothetical protein ABSF88_08035 [Candidatus Aminicenantales bacterium]|jgi:hypothetical protein
MKRKKYFIALAVTILNLAVFAQELRHDVSVVNIEVPVRVFKGEAFAGKTKTKIADELRGKLRKDIEVKNFSDSGRDPGLCPGVHFRRTRPWI